jgi:gamma-glutamylcyclotransferase (GGCT)/AIG2-like uncharacterized protein YtfP
MPTNIVAVYGDLREGLNNHLLVAKCQRIGLGWLTGFRMYNLGDYPGIIATNDESGRIRVEWYRVPDTVLKELDRLEGFNPDSTQTSLFLRSPILSPYGSSWIYLYNQPLNNAPYMEAGDWVRFIPKAKAIKETEKTYCYKQVHHYEHAVPA